MRNGYRVTVAKDGEVAPKALEVELQTLWSSTIKCPRWMASK